MHLCFPFCEPCPPVNFPVCDFYRLGVERDGHGLCELLCSLGSAGWVKLLHLRFETGDESKGILGHLDGAMKDYNMMNGHPATCIGLMLVLIPYLPPSRPMFMSYHAAW
jgi:hypothetical protein